jgi:hypothetical protein
MTLRAVEERRRSRSRRRRRSRICLSVRGRVYPPQIRNKWNRAKVAQHGDWGPRIHALKPVQRLIIAAAVGLRSEGDAEVWLISLQGRWFSVTRDVCSLQQQTGYFRGTHRLRRRRRRRRRVLLSAVLADHWQGH